jgi:hypothetical protein
MVLVIMDFYGFKSMDFTVVPRMIRTVVAWQETAFQNTNFFKPIGPHHETDPQWRAVQVSSLRDYKLTVNVIAFSR